jgi:hypothetical protein
MNLSVFIDSAEYHLAPIPVSRIRLRSTVLPSIHSFSLFAPSRYVYWLSDRLSHR